MWCDTPDAAAALSARLDTLNLRAWHPRSGDLHICDAWPVQGDSAALPSPGPERWHPHPEPIYDLGPLLDMGPYYLTTLIHLLGPVTSVRGASAVTRPLRTKVSGDTFTSTTPTHVDALLQTADGASVTVTTSFDAQGTTRHLEIYGTDGTLVLPDPNFHHGIVRLRHRGETTWDSLAPALPRVDVVGRGMGLLDLADALKDRARAQATGDLPCTSSRSSRRSGGPLPPEPGKPYRMPPTLR
ncbi:hypothetical protein [Microbispora sp. NPDC046933]|uniref:Gfo/Idh/MocA family protein n=1 Tax=Microbispora sp. NPDC046933 TaxID=3155618 RepID=UPI0033D1ED5F